MVKRHIQAISVRMHLKKLKGKNKELMIIPNAVHTDLYDKTDIIHFDKIDEFFKRNMN